MSAASARHRLLAALLFPALALSCELSTSILSEAERSALYTLALSSGGRALGNGAVLADGASVAASVSRMSGAEEPASLQLILAGNDGRALASLSLSTAAAKAMAPISSASSSTATTVPTTTSSTQVARIDGPLPSFVLPSGLTPGAYRLSEVLGSAPGAALQRSDMVVFVGTGEARIGSVTVYPPSAGPGESFLLSAAIGMASAKVGSTTTSDPWVRWSRDGSSFAEGRLSAGMDKVVWTAPRTEGAYALAVEAFPSAPPDASGFAFKAWARQELRAMVKAAPGGSGDEFSDPLSFASLLRLDGNFEDSGTRPRSTQPESFGKPSLDVYPGGFGYRFGPAAGVRIPDLMPPTEGGRLAAFSILVRLAPETAEGSIVRFESTDGSFSLSIGLHQGKPYTELVSDGRTSRSTATDAVPPGPGTFIVSFQSEADRLSVLWSVEGLRLHSPALPLPGAPRSGRAILGGPEALPAVYDHFGLIAQGAAPPAYRLAELRRWRAALVLAEGFEDDALPAGAEASAGVTAVSGALNLVPGSFVVLAPAFALNRPLIVEADLTGDASSASLLLSGPDGNAFLAVRGTGEVLDGEGQSIGHLPATEGRLSFALTPSGGKLSISSPGGGGALSPTVQAGVKASLVVRRTGGQGMLHVERVLVRAGP